MSAPEGGTEWLWPALEAEYAEHFPTASISGRCALEAHAPTVDMELDPGIRKAVLILRSGGIATFESCEGGAGHAFAEPTIKFQGSMWEGYRALAIAMEHGLHVRRIQFVYGVVNGHPEGPWWELVLHHTTGDRD